MTRTTFTDARGVTHEALNPVHSDLSEVSLCGVLRVPTKVSVGMRSGVIRVRVLYQAPEGVDCMTCIIARVKLECVVDCARWERMVYEGEHKQVTLDLRIRSWR